MAPGLFKSCVPGDSNQASEPGNNNGVQRIGIGSNQDSQPGSNNGVQRKEIGSNPASQPGNGVQRKEMFFRDGKYAYGEFSMAVMQRNRVLEQQSQIEDSRFGTFVGIYDGHEGHQASRFVCETLYQRFLDRCRTDGVDEKVLEKVFVDTDDAFKSTVDIMWQAKPQWESSGTCCLVGLIREDHDVKLPKVSRELLQKYQHEPDESPIIVGDKLKGIVQVAKSIGYVFMKYGGFNKEPLDERFRFPEPTHFPYMSAIPSTCCYDINVPADPDDSLSLRRHPDYYSPPTVRSLHSLHDYFLIFASRGLWDLMSNERAVLIVFESPREESAKHLVEEALKIAEKRRDCHRIHNDITVYVFFLDWGLISTEVKRKKERKVRKASTQGMVPLRSAPPEVPLKFSSS